MNGTTIKQRQTKLNTVSALVFEDKNRIEEFDFEHSWKEDRWKIIGKVDDVLFVVYTERGDATRLISARKATQYERSVYNARKEIYKF